jgi:hypothetical protein
MLGMSLVRLPFCVGTSVPSEASQKFLDSQRLGPREKTRKNKILLYKRPLMPSEACPQRTFLRNESKGMILPSTQFASKQEIPANYNSKISKGQFR